MKVVLFGASGMVGQGVLLECLRDGAVTQVLSVGRSASGQHDAKLTEIVRDNFLEYSDIEPQLTGFDACFFCLGVSSVGMDGERYRHLTYDITLAAARTLAQLNPQMTFVYVTGAGTDATEQGRVMWARVKGKTENDLLKLRFAPPTCSVPRRSSRCMASARRPPGCRRSMSSTAPLLSWLYRVAPKYVTTTEQMGRAMIKVARGGFPKPVLESEDINSL